MKLVLVLVAMLLAECSAVTDLGSCTTVSNSQVCEPVTEDAGGCSASIGWGTTTYSWTCNNEDFTCYRHCMDKLEQPAECVGIETRCSIYELYGTCTPFEGDCGFGSRTVTWDCGKAGKMNCPELCCCKDCAGTGSLIPQPMACDDHKVDIACLEPCPAGMTRRLANMPGCYILHPVGYSWYDSARDTRCPGYSAGSQVGHIVELLNDDYAVLLHMYMLDNTDQVWLGSKKSGGERRWFVDGRLVDDTALAYWQAAPPNIGNNCITFEDDGKMFARVCNSGSRFVCELLPWWP